MVADRGNVVMCDDCYSKHIEGLKRFAESIPTECGSCHRTPQQLLEAAGGGNFRMTAVWKDSGYQWLCGMCDLAYLQKRADLVKGTEFGTQVLKLS